MSGARLFSVTGEGFAVFRRICGVFYYFCSMARIMAIDYGSKRVGIAVTDALQIISTGLTTVHSKDLIEFLKNYLAKEEVECIVVGEPKRMNNEPSDSARFIEPFVMHLKRTFPKIKVERMDERFTSKMAFQTMIDSGLKKMDRRNKELVDEISATIILQSYMEKKKNNF
ncbi:MAG: Holliday junction resolvase [Bacteroidetes bacterium]|nr:Holliday junction resolvase [Bacteroidota bacterium]